jgi:spore coat polysaccharide biosynthesis predicted glycosyltransferase SpsG
LYDGDQINREKLDKYTNLNWVFLPNENRVAEENIFINELEPIDLMIIDRLESSDEQWSLWREHSNFILIFSDLGHSCPVADAVIYPQHLDRSVLPEELPGQNIYVGPEYFVLDEKILEYSKIKKINKNVHEILISLGGWWQPSMMATITDFLKKMGKHTDLHIEWVTGKGIDLQCFDEIKKSFQNIELHEYANDFMSMVYSADMAVIGGGFVKYDTMAIGTPSVVLSLIEHQEKMTIPFHRKGALIYAGSIENVSGKELAEIILKLAVNFRERIQIKKISQNIVDGEGIMRVQKIICDAIKNHVNFG